MKNSKPLVQRDVSTLGLRLWEFTGTAFVNLFIFIILMVYLSPLSYIIISSLKGHFQLQDSYAPIWPAQAVTYIYEGRELDVYDVPTADGVRQLALVKGLRASSDLIDPKAPEAGLIHWDGSWR